MPDTREISALTTAESTSASDLFETALPNAMTETGYISRKVTLGTIANFLLSTLQFSSLHTTVKNIIGAINELAQGSGQSLDTLNDVDIDTQTLTNGQGIVYDATAQKWKNGAVSGGAHTYSTTEQVVGTWTDGSPVYEKTYIKTMTSGTTDCDFPFTDIADYKAIIELNGLFDNSIPFNLSGACQGTSRFNISSLSQYAEYGYIQSSGIRVSRNSAASYSSAPSVIVTIRYIKSST